jgi:thymidylate synthase ThyX
MIAVTGNARSWRHFLEVRGDIPGDHEMRIVSSLVLRAIGSSSGLFSDFTEELLDDGLPVVRRPQP